MKLLRTCYALQVMVTAASFNHLCPLLAMLDSVHRLAPNHAVVVYDLDPEPPFIVESWLTRVHPKFEPSLNSSRLYTAHHLRSVPSLPPTLSRPTLSCHLFIYNQPFPLDVRRRRIMRGKLMLHARTPTH